MIQFITHSNERYDHVEGAKLALQGGCRWIQLRMKDAMEIDFLRAAKKIRRLCDEYHATFILDDHVEWVGLTGADGVHLGKNDMPVDEARKMLGRNKIIGGTANTCEDVERISRQGADYIGCGPFRFTTTKEKLSPILGLEGYKDIIQKMKEESIDIPLVAIGGITKEDIPEIMKTGVNGIALSGCILHAENPAEETREILALL